MPGSFFSNRYELIERIAEGATSELYRARHRLDDADADARTYAIKLLRRELSSSQEFVIRTRREAKALHRLLAHPNIVQLVDVGRWQDGRVFLALEFVEGESLDAMLD